MADKDDKSRRAVRVAQAGGRPSVDVSIPGGTNLNRLLADTELISVIRQLHPGGCETCISGQDIFLHQFEEVVLVEFEA